MSRKTVRFDAGAMGSVVFVVGLLGAVWCREAVGRDLYLTEVRRQLVGAGMVLGLGDFELTHHTKVGKIYWYQPGAVLTLDLDRGREYAIVGVCDRDCRDVDLVLHDGVGRLIDEDTGTDDYPLVRVLPRYHDRFAVRVIMHDCRARRCSYGVGVFGKR
jgi:hypothetical protein